MTVIAFVDASANGPFHAVGVKYDERRVASTLVCMVLVEEEGGIGHVGPGGTQEDRTARTARILALETPFDSGLAVSAVVREQEKDSGIMKESR